MKKKAIAAAEIREVPIAKLKAAAYNPRVDLKPGDEQYDALQNSLQEFGYVEPIVWNEITGNVVGGHQRLKVLAAAGARVVQVSVVRIKDISKEKAFNVALNRISGEWDDKKLAALMSDIYADDPAPLAGPARLTASGELLTGSIAGMESGGQLSPRHSLWIMLGPSATAWLNCAERVIRSTSRKRKDLSNP